ncbi:PH domain-containing protein [Alteromonas halophila]|uniref:YdbS-like PH domain-containing protein n=1 Tax=Alteromonas halophila TaxID=516698 RepID=A0A918JS05_9ALTE|nr:PH domain-containing protein [Alteromonas halophila]GGW97850.1 hypothetical protein GCM10007391_34810 [Alteromonas halophila]
MEPVTETSTGSPQVDTGEHWQRLSAISILHFSLGNVKDLAQSALYIIPALAVTANVMDNIHGVYGYLILAGIVLTMLVSGVLHFWLYRFRVHAQHVEIKSGVLSRRHTNLPFWRIQNVKIEQPFYYRPFGYALVILDTAGSAKEEAEIVAVPLHYAYALKAQVLRQSRDPVPSDSAGQAKTEEALSDDEEVLNRRTIADLVIHGITNNRVWILLGAAAPFYDSLAGFVGDWLTSHGLSLTQLVDEQTMAWWQVSLYSLMIATVVMALLAMISVGGSLFTFYGYTLSRDGDRYIRRSGLLNKQEVSMRASRIQLVSAKQDWLDKILKRVNLYFEQNTSGQTHNQELTSPNKLLVPSVTEAECAELVSEVLPDNALYNQRYIAISRHYLSHCFLLWVAPTAIALTVFAASIMSYKEVVVIVVVSALIMALLVLRWWRWGVAEDDTYVYVRSGRLGVDYTCFERAKVQQVVVKQSVFMARKQLASVQFVLASGTVTVPFLPQTLAYQLADDTLYTVESTRRSWM